MLDKKLLEYSKSDMYPFHMPGHKRNSIQDYNPYQIDITEIEGFDNLHNATGILKSSQQRAADLYGSKQAYYLINGSTCGILAAISAATEKGDKILVARNCHKAVYNAIFLRELSPIYIYPSITKAKIQGKIDSLQVKQALEEDPDIKVVVITSPTYDGIVSDIAAISEIVHSHNIPLIVDQAHGAHFGIDKRMPESAIKLGADAVIVSVHKTLPAFTQTALLHICSDRISEKKIKRYLGIYETSSPSYILMAGIESCIRFILEKGEELFEEFDCRLDHLYAGVKSLNNLKVLTCKDFSTDEAYDFDRSKIIIMTENSGISGEELLEILYKEYHIQLEMAAGNYALALSTLMDTEEGFERLKRALIEIDSKLSYNKNDSNLRKRPDSSIYNRSMEKALEIHEASDKENEIVDYDAAIGRMSGEFIYLYPPGIPLIVPGEIISADFIRDLQAAVELGLDVKGLTEDKRIIILKG